MEYYAGWRNCWSGARTEISSFKSCSPSSSNRDDLAICRSISAESANANDTAVTASPLARGSAKNHTSTGTLLKYINFHSIKMHTHVHFACI